MWRRGASDLGAGVPQNETTKRGIAAEVAFPSRVRCGQVRADGFILTILFMDWDTIHYSSTRLPRSSVYPSFHAARFRL